MVAYANDINPGHIFPFNDFCSKFSIRTVYLYFVLANVVVE